MKIEDYAKGKKTEVLEANIPIEQRDDVCNEIDKVVLQYQIGIITRRWADQQIRGWWRFALNGGY